jgi:hypothetical protein
VARAENIARAGDALVVHGWTPHSASRNMRSSPRLAVIGRWNDKRRSLGPVTREETEAFEAKLAAGAAYTNMECYGPWHTVPSGLFDHWGEELKAAAASVPAEARL